MATLKIETESSDLKKVEDSFDNLTKAQQKMVLANSSLGKQMQDSKEKQKLMNKELKEAEKMNPFNKLAAGVKSFIGAYAGFKGFQLINDEMNNTARQAIDNMRKVNEEAAAVSRGVNKGLGNILFNDPELISNPTLANEIRDSIQKMAVSIGEPDLDKVFGEYSRLRPLTQEIKATEQEKLGSFREAKKMQQMDPSLDAAGAAATWLQLSKKEEISLEAAATMLSEAAKTTSLDTGQFLARVSPLLNQTNRGISSADVLSWFATANTSTKGLKPGQSESFVGRAIGTMADMESVTVGGKKIKFDDNASIGDKMMAVVQNAKTLPPAELNKFVKSLKMSEEDNAVLFGFIENADTFAANRVKIAAGARASNYFSENAKKMQELSPSRKVEINANQAKARVSVARNQNIGQQEAQYIKEEGIALFRQSGGDTEKKPMFSFIPELISGKPVNTKIDDELTLFIDEMQKEGRSREKIREEVREKIFNKAIKVELQKALDSIERTGLKGEEYTNAMTTLQELASDPKMYYYAKRGVRDGKVMGVNPADFESGLYDDIRPSNKDPLKLINFSDGINQFEQAVLSMTQSFETVGAIMRGEVPEGVNIRSNEDMKTYLRNVDKLLMERLNKKEPVIKQEDIQ